MPKYIPFAPFGVEVAMDLRNRSSADDELLIDLYARHHLMVFRDQQITLEEQLDLVRLFAPDQLDESERTGILTNTKAKDNFLGDSELAFHSDLSFFPKPYQAMSLFGLEVEPGRSSTRFVDTSKVYAAMPEMMRRRIDGLHTLQVWGFNLTGRNEEALAETMPSHVHPVVAKLPRTGAEFLMVSSNQTARIVELEPEASEELILELFDYLYAPEQIYEHSWHLGDLVVWDNAPIQHARGPVGDVGVRRLRRAIASEAGMKEQLPPDFVLTTSAVA